MKHSDLKRIEPVYTSGLDCGMQCTVIMAVTAFFQATNTEAVALEHRAELLRSFVRHMADSITREPTFDEHTVHLAIERIRGAKGGDDVANKLVSLLGDA